MDSSFKTIQPLLPLYIARTYCKKKINYKLYNKYLKNKNKIKIVIFKYIDKLLLYLIGT